MTMGNLAALLLVGTVCGAFFLLTMVVFYALYRQLSRSTIVHEDLGEVAVFGKEGVARVSLDGRPCDASFPIVRGKIGEATVRVLQKLQDRYRELRGEIGREAIREWDEIADSYTSPDDREMHDRMMKLKVEPERFLREFEIEGVRLEDPPGEIRVEYLTPWDPEHTRSVRLNFDLEIVGYGLTCAL